MFDQRNQSFQSIILSSSVMFAALSTVIIQGFLPPNSSEAIFIAYALTCSLSFAFLFLSVVLSIEVILRASSFMYHRARRHTLDLREAIRATKLKLDGMRNASIPLISVSADDDDRVGGGFVGAASHDSHDEGRTMASERLSEVSGRSKTTTTKSVKFERQSVATADGRAVSEVSERARRETATTRHEQVLRDDDEFARQIAKMSESDVDKMWKHHEAELQEYLLYRERINDKTAVIELNTLQTGDRVEVNRGGLGAWLPAVIVKVRSKDRTFNVLYDGEDVADKKVDIKLIRLPGSESGSAESLYRGNFLNRKSFEDFWSSSCGFWADAAISFFYLGTVTLLLAILIWMWSFFLLNYNSFAGALIAVVLILLSLVAGLYLVWSIRTSEVYTSKSEAWSVGGFGLGSSAKSRKSTKNSNANANAAATAGRGRNSSNRGRSSKARRPTEVEPDGAAGGGYWSLPGQHSSYQGATSVN